MRQRIHELQPKQAPVFGAGAEPLKPLLVAAMLLLSVPAPAQPIPGSEGWLLTPMQAHGQAPPQMSDLDVALVRCYRSAIATGAYFLGDVNYVLGQCRGPLAAWTAACEHREGQDAAICLLGPQQAVGEALSDAWAHRNDLKSWLTSLPPLPGAGSRQNPRGDGGGAALR
jgi:hypothetical protein